MYCLRISFEHHHYFVYYCAYVLYVITLHCSDIVVDGLDSFQMFGIIDSSNEVISVVPIEYINEL